MLIKNLIKAFALQDAIFNSHNFSSIATDASGVIQIFNVGAETMLGYSAAEVVNIMTPADLSDKEELHERAESLSLEFDEFIQPGFDALVYKAKRGIEDNYELTYLCKKGHRLAAQVSVTPLRDEQQTLIGYLLIGTDSTARKLSEKLLVTKLKEASALQDAIFNSRHFSSIATDAQGVIQIFNVGAETMLGFSAAEVVNIMTPADLSDKEELIERADRLSLEFGEFIRPGFEALVYKAARSIEDSYELTYLCQNGSRLAAMVSVTALRDEQASIIGYLLIGTDNTARKMAEQCVGITSAAFDSVQGMFITDENGLFSHVNKAFIEISGYNKEELLGKSPSILKSGLHDARFYQKIWRKIKTRGYWVGEIWNKRKNGEVYCEQMSINKVLDHHNKVVSYVATFSDLSQLKAYETGLIDAKEKAERFSTLKSQFIASMSHEIRTPMTAIIGFSELALYEDMTKEVRAYVQNINTASTSLLGILQDILDFTKLEAGRVVIEAIPFNLLDLLNTLSTLFNGSAQQKGLTFTIKRDSRIPLELIGDKLRLQQVLTNLVGNALKFTKQGSIKLELTLQNISLTEVQLLFSVTDTGIGIALEDQDKLFVEFSQVDGSFTRQYGGTGLGLVISKELIELMGGEIFVVSTPNQGSCFSFIVQLETNTISIGHQTSEASTKIQHISKLDNSLKGFRVLVVEDNRLSQELIQKHLAMIGIETQVASNGAQALTLLEQHEFDAVLMDIHMPVMNGIEATQQIRQQAKFVSLPIIALSAGVTELERNNCIACGMVGFIAKPIDVEQLCAVLGLWLRRSSVSGYG
jgi:PAS domain S-box-containing protein